MFLLAVAVAAAAQTPRADPTPSESASPVDSAGPSPQVTPALPNPTPTAVETQGPVRPRLGARLYFDSGLRYMIGHWLPEAEGMPILHALTDLSVAGRIGGRLEIDVAAFTTTGKAGPIADNAEVRRARLFTSGQLLFLTSTYYKFEFGIEGQNFYLNDFLLRWEFPSYIDSAQIGYFTAPLGLEEIGSPVFMENSLPVAAFAPGFKSGAQVHRSFEALPVTLTLGLFSESQLQDSADASSGALRLHTRLTWRPEFTRSEDGGLNMIHLGLASGWVFSGGEDIQYRARPESHLAPYLADTDSVAANDAFLVGLEGALVRGPWSVQAEAIRSTVLVREDSTDLNFSGAYVLGTWSLTGESRNYDTQTAAFYRIDPRSPLTMHGGCGAVEVAARLSWLDLNDRFVNGGRMRDASAAVNWYLNRYLSLSLNYVYSDVSGGQRDGTVNLFESRLGLRY